MKPNSICPAMRAAGITDPESQEGIRFCTEQCPYNDDCILCESIKPSIKAKNIRIEKAKLFASCGWTVENIAKCLRRSTRTIERYLENK